jgi:general secretion pathway protein F
VMRCLALAVSYSWPMNKTVWQLARIYPKRGMRGRLANAGRQIDNGEDWCNSLRNAGIIHGADWSVLKSAQRVGNLEWALDEMADSSVRRLIYRWRVFLNVVFPIVLLTIGIIVGAFAIGFFFPLVRLVESLT